MRHNNNLNTKRYGTFSVVTFLFLTVLIMRLMQIQVGMGGFDVDEDGYYKLKKILPPERGKILDRNLKLLAFNIPTVSVVAHPNLIGDI
jgi:cell division protein FtsI/penicillin-binding protein 2